MRTRPPSLRRVAATPLTTVVFALALFGCGGEPVPPAGPPPKGEAESGEGGSTSSRQPVPPPEPAEKLETTVRKFGAAAAQGDCTALQRLSYSGLPKLPERGCANLRRRLEGFDARRGTVYGTGAVIDFDTRRKPGSVVFVLGPDRRFRWVLLLRRSEGVEVARSRAPEGVDADSAAERVVGAIRAGDCKRFEALAASQLRKEKKAAPRGRQGKALGRQCSGSTPFRKALQQDPGAAPERLGANSRVAFYRLSAEGGRRYFTVVMLFEGGEARYLRAYPVPPRRAAGGGEGSRRPSR